METKVEMTAIQVMIKLKHTDKEAPKSSAAISIEIETDSPEDMICDVAEAVRRHALNDLQIPLFGEGDVRIVELADKEA